MLLTRTAARRPDGFTTSLVWELRSLVQFLMLGWPEWLFLLSGSQTAQLETEKDELLIYLLPGKKIKSLRDSSTMKENLSSWHFLDQLGQTSDLQTIFDTERQFSWWPTEVDFGPSVWQGWEWRNFSFCLDLNISVICFCVATFVWQICQFSNPNP